jgi:hypothetical protein
MPGGVAPNFFPAQQMTKNSGGNIPINISQAALGNKHSGGDNNLGVSPNKKK